ncbi:hypothetical protein Tco_0675756 [Tanacetum coccineum]
MFALKFAKTHNMVAFLEKPSESEGFEQIIDFLNASTIKYVLIVNTTVYVSSVDQFWMTAQVKKVNEVTEIYSLVDGKQVVVFEATIRSTLQFGDEGGVECLPNSTIFEEISRIGYENLSQKLTFFKAFFSPQWKFMIHTILQCLSAKTTTWNKFTSTMASEIICLATNQRFKIFKFILEGMLRNLDPKVTKFLMYPRFIQLFVNQVEGLPHHHRKYNAPCHSKKIYANMKKTNKDFSGNDTPFFPIMVVHAPPPTTTIIPPTTTITPPPPTTTPPATTSTPIPPQPTTSIHPSQLQKQRIRKPTRRVTEVPQPNEPELSRVLELEQTKSSQQMKIESLERKVKKLEKNKKRRTHKLKRLYKVGLSARVISLEDEEPNITLVDKVEGRKDEIRKDDLMFDKEKDLASEDVVAQAKAAKDLNEDEITLAQTLQKLNSTPKAKEVTIREPSDTQRSKVILEHTSKDKGKAKMIEPENPMKRKDHILFDEQETRRLKYIFDEKARVAKEQAQKEASNAELVEEWDNVQAMMDADYELAKRLQVEEQGKLTIEEKSRLFVELMDKRKKHFSSKRAQEKRSKPLIKA